MAGNPYFFPVEQEEKPGALETRWPMGTADSRATPASAETQLPWVLAEPPKDPYHEHDMNGTFERRCQHAFVNLGDIQNVAKFQKMSREMKYYMPPMVLATGRRESKSPTVGEIKRAVLQGPAI